MTLSRSAIALIGQRHPEIFELFGNPVGPYFRAGREVFLNPQSLPPKDAPLAAGVRAGQEIVHLAATAQALGTDFALEDDYWMPFDREAWLAWFVGHHVHDVVEPTPHPNWDLEYLAGVALAIEGSEKLWRGFKAADQLDRIHEKALAAAEAGALNSG